MVLHFSFKTYTIKITVDPGHFGVPRWWRWLCGSIKCVSNIYQKHKNLMFLDGHRVSWWGELKSVRWALYVVCCFWCCTRTAIFKLFKYIQAVIVVSDPTLTHDYWTSLSYCTNLFFFYKFTFFGCSLRSNTEGSFNLFECMSKRGCYFWSTISEVKSFYSQTERLKRSKGMLISSSICHGLKAWTAKQYGSNHPMLYWNRRNHHLWWFNF